MSSLMMSPRKPNWNDSSVCTEWIIPGLTCRQTDVTQADCDAFAVDVLNYKITAPKWQGFWSYTVFTHTGEVLQSRWAGSPDDFDVEMTHLAKFIHPHAPKTTYVGRIPDTEVGVGKMSRQPGVNFRDTIETLSEKKLRRIARGLAAFFAQSYNQSLVVSDDKRRSMRCRYELGLLDLMQAAPIPIATRIQVLFYHLDDIMDLRHVLTHTDISWTNILVHPTTGSLTGVIDWANASIEPFGKALWALEHVLTLVPTTEHGPIFFDEVLFYRQIFEDFLADSIGVDIQSEEWQTIMWAKTMGVMLRYGYKYDDVSGTTKISGNWERIEI